MFVAVGSYDKGSSAIMKIGGFCSCGCIHYFVCRSGHFEMLMVSTAAFIRLVLAVRVVLLFCCCGCSCDLIVYSCCCCAQFKKIVYAVDTTDCIALYCIIFYCIVYIVLYFIILY